MSGSTCPFCAEPLDDAGANRCPHCGESLLKGSPCEVHPEQELVETCRRCARYVCPSCKDPDSGGCVHCKDEGVGAADAKAHYELGEILGAVTKDPDWVSKVLLGGVCLLTGGLLVPMFALLGYRLRIIRQQRRKPDTETLPEWDDFGGLIREGFRIWVVEVLPVLGLVLIFALFMGTGAALLAVAKGKGGMAVAGGIVMVCGYAVFLISILIFSYFLPAIEMEYLDTGDLTSGLKFKRIWARISADHVDYLLFFVFHYLINQVLGPLGLILCFVGLYATVPWAMFTDGILFGRYLAKKDQANAKAA